MGLAYLLLILLLPIQPLGDLLNIYKMIIGELTPQEVWDRTLISNFFK